MIGVHGRRRLPKDQRRKYLIGVSLTRAEKGLIEAASSNKRGPGV